jgi:hypothetical protein
MSDQIPFNIDENAPLLVELEAAGGVQPVAIVRMTPERLEELTGKSQKALDSAMSAVTNMARRVKATLTELPASELPDKIELGFGLKLNAEAGAYIAKSGVEAAIDVKLVWERAERPLPVIPQVGGEAG